MPRFILGKGATKAIYNAVSALFARAKARFLGHSYGPKEISFGARPVRPVGFREDLSLPGIFDYASRAQGGKPSDSLREAVVRVADQYLNAHEELAKARVVNAVQSFISEAEANPGKAPDVKTVLGGELAQLMGTVSRNLKTIVDTESTRAHNLGAIDVISKVSVAAGQKDPVVAFIGPNDGYTCGECQRLFFLPDGTPKAWRMSEIGHAYHKRGDEDPKIGGCHPNCRHRPVAILPGYGFDSSGKIAFISPGHDEWTKQRNL